MRDQLQYFQDGFLNPNGYTGQLAYVAGSGQQPPSGFVFLYDDDGVTQLFDDDGITPLLDVA